MRRLIRSRLIWIYTVCKCVSEFTWCRGLPDFILLYSCVEPALGIFVPIAYANNEGSGEPAHPHSLARTFPARTRKVWKQMNTQTKN